MVENKFDDTKKLSEVLADLGNVIGEVFEDGKVSVSDYPALGSAVKILWKISDIDFKDFIQNELINLANDEEALELLRQSFKESFDIPQDKLEATIKTVGQILINIVIAVMKFKKSK